MTTVTRAEARQINRFFDTAKRREYSREGNPMFTSASEVKKHLRSKGIADKVSVRKSTNPFSGRDTFWITVPGEGPQAQSGGSNAPTGFYGSNAGLRQHIHEALQGTGNAYVE